MDVDTETETNDEKTDTAGTPQMFLSRSGSPVEQRRRENL